MRSLPSDQRARIPARRADDSQVLGGLGGESPISDDITTSSGAAKRSRKCVRGPSGEASCVVALTNTAVQTMAHGQSFPQSGIAGWSSGQHGMPSGISAVAGNAIAAEIDGATGASRKATNAIIASSRVRNAENTILELFARSCPSAQPNSGERATVEITRCGAVGDLCFWDATVEGRYQAFGLASYLLANGTCTVRHLMPKIADRPLISVQVYRLTRFSIV